MDILSELAACLCAQIEEDESPRTCFCGIVFGEAAAQSYSGNCRDACGMAWVRLAAMYPMSAIGEQDTTLGNCGKEFGVDIEMGVMRCVNVGDERGNPPTQESLYKESLQAMADARSMYRAVYCCAAIDTMDVIVGQYTPLGPAGGLAGGTVTLSAALDIT